MKKTITSEEKRVACPAYEVCDEMGTARPTCRYDRGSAPIGLSTYKPEDEWCPRALAALLLLLKRQEGVHAAEEGRAGAEEIRTDASIPPEIKQWVQETCGEIARSQGSCCDPKDI